jgi:predicted nucleic acid-binding protein
MVVETFALLQRRMGIDAVAAFWEEICPALTIHWVDESTHRAAAAALLAAGRRKLSLVDCVSFEVMRQTGVERVFCFDPHFEQAGFTILSPADLR